jgi:hypothetical protein
MTVAIPAATGPALAPHRKSRTGPGRAAFVTNAGCGFHRRQANSRIRKWLHQNAAKSPERPGKLWPRRHLAAKIGDAITYRYSTSSRQAAPFHHPIGDKKCP